MNTVGIIIYAIEFHGFRCKLMKWDIFYAAFNVYF